MGFTESFLFIITSNQTRYNQWFEMNFGIFLQKNKSFLSFAGLTIDRIYSLLEQCTDEQFLICLLSLLRNLFSEKDTEVLLPMFNSGKLLTVGMKISLKQKNSIDTLNLDFTKNIGEKLSRRNST